MINGGCFTHKAGYDKCKWPTRFAALPRVGDWVMSMNSLERVLVVIGVIHWQREHDGEPMIKVELGPLPDVI
jgi:hypothetical protein